MSQRIFLIAAESSGDALGADLAHALRRRDAALELMGVGGPLMNAAGIPSQVDIAGLAILGFVDGLLAYGRVKRAVNEAVAAILAAKPDAVVLIDSWGFTLRVAHGVRAAAPHIKLIKYVGPQVWATRPGRAKTLAAAVDHLICIHDFEVPYYAPYGLACTVCGHPALGRHKPGDAAAFRARNAVAAGDKLLLILPGSRASEIRRVGPTLWRAAARLQQQRRDLRLMVVVADAVREAVLAQTPPQALIVHEREKEDAFAAAIAAIAASGTVTTEVALQETPVVVGYKLGWITWAVARLFLFKGTYVTLMNVAVNKEVAPELLQTKFTPARIAAATAPLLDDADARAAQVRAQDEALARMGRGATPASEIAADAVLRVMKNGGPIAEAAASSR
ncbi:lipid-A-disaccharide synthase [Terricaulis sp.]|uniref:lipid-A-disaccharide synthase n=1 Tax=Terricaulis sp. TaxID=2768686 RepID=UPI003783F5C8